MNDLILSVFGDPYITLQCEGGECLHYSQVPGYVVRANNNYLASSYSIGSSVPPNLTIHAGWLSALLVLV